jgi:hypothetical protein
MSMKIIKYFHTKEPVLRKKKSVPSVVRIPEGVLGENKRTPHKNRKVMWKDGERNESSRRCE